MSKSTKKPAVSEKAPTSPAGDAQPPTKAKGLRRLRTPQYRSFKLQKKIQQAPDRALPSGFRILRDAIRLLITNWKIVGIFFVIFALINLVVVQSVASTDDIDKLKSSIDGLVHGDLSQLGASAALIVMLATASGSQGASGTSYQLVWLIMGSLAFVWLLREMHAKNKVRVRDAFYKGMYPLVPFMLVLLVMGIELLPATIGGTAFSTLMSNGIASTFVEQLLWGVVCFMFASITLFLLASSIFALYIACLPDMTPIRALRSARSLVAHQRSVVLRRLIFLPIALLVIGCLIMIPLVLLVPVAAVIAFFLLNVLGLMLLHSYLYGMYRALL